MWQTFFNTLVCVFGPLPCGLEYEQSMLELEDVQATGMMRFPLQARAYGLPGLVFHIVVEMDGVHGSCSLNRYVALQRRYVPMHPQLYDSGSATPCKTNK